MCVCTCLLSCLQVVGFIAGYEETRDEKLRVAVTNFFDMVNAHHGFATAGTSAFERWQKPDTLGRALEEMVGRGRLSVAHGCLRLRRP